MNEEIKNKINLDKSRHEIALVNKNSTEVYYGVDSLMKIIGSKLPLFDFLFNRDYIKFFIKPVYNFVSYNRHIIIPRPIKAINLCTPDFSYFWRIMYMVMSILLTSFVLNNYFQNTVPYYVDVLVILIQLVLQTMVYGSKNSKSIFDYLGNNCTVMNLGSILLVPGLVIQHWINDAIFDQTYLALVACILFIEHHRRIKLRDLPIRLSISWLLFRIGLALFINWNYIFLPFSID
jgi:hypothetical protein